MRAGHSAAVTSPRQQRARADLVEGQNARKLRSARPRSRIARHRCWFGVSVYGGLQASERVKSDEIEMSGLYRRPSMLILTFQFRPNFSERCCSILDRVVRIQLPSSAAALCQQRLTFSTVFRRRLKQRNTGPPGRLSVELGLGAKSRLLGNPKQVLRRSPVSY